MRRSLSTVLVALALANLGLSAQGDNQTAEAARPPATAAIIGVVSDEDTGKPLAGAIVSWSPGSGTSRGARRDLTQVLTGADGRFLLSGLVAGQYALNARKGGYLPASPGSPTGATGMYIDLAEGQIRADVKIAMARPGTITGAVLDDAGDPVIGVQLQAVRRIRSRGRTIWQPAGGSMKETDGRSKWPVPISGD